METRPTDNQPPAGSYRAVGAELSGMGMEEKGVFLHDKLTEYESILRIGYYYQQLAYGSLFMQSYREENADLFDRYEQEYLDQSYPLYTGSLNTDYALFTQLCDEYDTVAAYPEFLDSVQAKANQLAGISIFQKDETGYDLKNIDLTAQVYAGLGETVIDYYPQKGLYTAISYAFTDLILLAGILVLALLLVRRERDSGLLSLVRSLPGGRLKTALAKLGAFALSLLAVLALLYGVNLAYCGAAFGLGPLTRTIQSVPALMRCTMQITVGQYLFRFLLAKWAGAFVMGLWVMLAALTARRAVAGWAAALVGPLVMFGIRAVIPATSRWNVLKYANLASLLQTNELLGNYRNLYWFGAPVGLPLVEWTAAVLYGGALGLGFCLTFTRARLLPAANRGFVFGLRHKTRATSVYKEEVRKLLLLNGAAVVLAAFVGFGIYQGVTAESYIGADEIYYAYYMKHVSGPFTQESYDWLEAQGEEFAPMLEAQQKVAAGELSSDALLAFTALQQKYSVYSRIVSRNVNSYLKEHPGAWLVLRERLPGTVRLHRPGGRAGYTAGRAGLRALLFGAVLDGAARRYGDDPLHHAAGPQAHGAAKLAVSAVAAAGIAAALLPAASDSGTAGLRPARPAGTGHEHPGIESIPAVFTLSDMLLFWFLCRVAACLCMGAITLTLGRVFGNLLPALFVSAVGYCLPALLSLSGMEGGIEWLGFWPLFHAAELLTTQGYGGPDALPYNYAWVVILIIAAALLGTLSLWGYLRDCYERKGLNPDAAG